MKPVVQVKDYEIIIKPFFYEDMTDREKLEYCDALINEITLVLREKPIRRMFVLVRTKKN